MQCSLDHIVLNVENEEAMISFYSQVLMLSTERLEEYKAGKAPFPSVRLNQDTIIDLFPKQFQQQHNPVEQGGTNLNHFCVTLSKETWKNLLDRLQANNVDTEDGPVSRWGAHGTGISIYFRDPDRNLIEARYYESEKSPKKSLPESF